MRPPPPNSTCTCGISCHASSCSLQDLKSRRRSGSWAALLRPWVASWGSQLQTQPYTGSTWGPVQVHDPLGFSFLSPGYWALLPVTHHSLSSYSVPSKGISLQLSQKTAINVEESATQKHFQESRSEKPSGEPEKRGCSNFGAC